MSRVPPPKHTMALSVNHGRVHGSCSCGGWYRSTADDGHGQKRLAEKFLDHLRSWR